MWGSDDLVIAKYNAEHDAPPGENIEGFPTIKFYGKNTKEGRLYKGDRTLEGF